MSQGSGDAAEKRNEPPPSKIEALDGSNYEEWSGRMRSAFKRYKLLKLAMGEEKMPEEGDARDRWIEKSAVLYDLILQSVNNDMFQHIKDLVELDDSGPNAWTLLCDVIQPNTLPMVIVLEKELAALSMRPSDDVKPVLDKIKDTYARMAAAGSNVSQMQQCAKIISVLDNSWDNLIPTLNTQQDQWTPEWLRQQILQEDFRRHHTGGGAANKTAEGYGAAGGSRGRGGGRGQGQEQGQSYLRSNQLPCKLGKLLLWDLEEKSSCIKDLWQLPIIPWNGKPPATPAAATSAKATTGGEETAPIDGALDAVKKVQQPQQPHGEVLAGVDATAAWAKASSGSGEADWETWHERLCHVNFPMLQKLVKDGSLKGLEGKGAVKEIGSCPTCLEIKFKKFPFSSGTGPAKAPLALVHMDMVGPTRAPSLSGSRYFLTTVDDHTRAVWVYPLKTKGEVSAAVLKEWMPRAQRESGHKVKVIRTDNGGEPIGADFEAVLKKKGIQHQLTVPYNPQQNGVAEHFNRTLQEGARTLLGRAGLPDPFWVTALWQVALVKNRVLATVGDKQWVPYTKWYGSAPAVNILRAYGCMVVFHVPKEKRRKLEASGRWGVHLGLAKDHKGWLIWDLTSQQLTVSRDVKFLESLYYKEWKQQQQKLPTTPLIIEADEVQWPSRQVQVTISEEEIFGVTEDGGEPEVEEQQQQQQQDAPQGAARPADRPRRDVRPPNQLTYPRFGKPKVVRAGSVAKQCDEEEIAHCYWAAVPEPKTLVKALSGPDAEKWKDVKFLESLYYKEWKQQQQKLPTTPLIIEADEVQRPSRQVQVTVSDEEISGVTEDGGEPEVEEQQQQQQQQQDAPPRAQRPLDRPRRDVRPPSRPTYPSFGTPKVVRAGSVAEQCDEDEIAHCYWAAVPEPKTLAEALSGPDAEKWKQSVKEEYDSLLENETWELCELPPGKKAISSKLIFRHKYGPDGELTCYKSRLVAKGFQQTKGKDFDEIFAPVRKGTTLRVMLGTAANRGWRIKQMDITTAFLNGIILEELYMLQLEGLDDGCGRVCMLKKAIYGLKQAPRAWYHKLEETLLAGGFKKSECDHSLFLLQEKEQFLMLLVYVDGTSIGGYVCLFGGGAVSWRTKKKNEVGLSSCETEYMALHHGAK
ncbi:unnamed protein product [Closterium sp. NIES-54]